MAETGQTIELTLPPPPSVNGMYFNVPGKGRRKSEVYKAWIFEAGWTLKAQRPGKITGPYELRIVLPKMRKGRDTDNTAKPISDLLVKHQVTPDDKHCRRIEISRDDDATSVRVEVREAA